jgi:adenosine kinase
MAKFLGMGNPLLDISAEVGQDVLDKYGLKMNNAILADESHVPLYKELMAMPDVSYIGGGATQNSMRVAQWMMQEAGATAYIGSVGKDEYAKQLLDCVTADGVAAHYQEDDAATGTCAVLISAEGERSLCANLAAANNYKIAHFQKPEIQAVVAAATHIYSAGFFFTVSPETIQATGAHCAEHNKVYAMNLSAPFITQFFTEHVTNAMPFVDIMFGNESEAEAFGEKMEWGKDVKTVAKKIAAMDKTNTKRARICVITQGADSTFVAHADGSVVEYAVPPLTKDEIKDVNGAGDAFVGGFMAALIQGKEEKACVDAGHYAASCILKVSGCAVPTTAPIM